MLLKMDFFPFSIHFHLSASISLFWIIQKICCDLILTKSISRSFYSLCFSVMVECRKILVPWEFAVPQHDFVRKGHCGKSLGNGLHPSLTGDPMGHQIVWANAFRTHFPILSQHSGEGAFSGAVEMWMILQRWMWACVTGAHMNAALSDVLFSSFYLAGPN